MYVRDVVRAAVIAATTDVEGTYNIGTGVATTVNELCRRLIGLTGKRAAVEHLPARPGEITRSCLRIC